MEDKIKIYFRVLLFMSYIFYHIRVVAWKIFSIQMEDFDRLTWNWTA